jgi:tol-pal system protein YbgF
MTRTRVRALGALLGVAVLLGGCATKRDIRTLRDQMQNMQDRQDEVLRDIQRQNMQLLDSIRATMSLTQDVRGATTGQLRQFEQNVNQLGNLVSQVMGTLTRIEQRLTALEQRPVGATVSGGGTADEYYGAGIESMNAGRPSVARPAFEALVAEFPNHERAPDAQYQIAESFYLEKEYDKAYAELEKIVQRWSELPKAREALMRAGAIAEEQKDVPKARGFYQRVVDRYRDSDEGRLAARKLTQLPRR